MPCIEETLIYMPYNLQNRFSANLSYVLVMASEILVLYIYERKNTIHEE